MRLRTSDKELAKKPGDQSGKESGDWIARAAGKIFAQLRGFLLSQHGFHRETEPDHSAGVGLPAAENTLPRKKQKLPRWPSGASEKLLQLRAATSCVEAWAEDEDSGDAGRLGLETAQFSRHLYDYRRVACLFCRYRWHHEAFEQLWIDQIGRLTTVSDGSTEGALRQELRLVELAESLGRIGDRETQEWRLER
jgi:hypothetical protein